MNTQQLCGEAAAIFKRHRTLFSNFSFLAFIQVFNLGLPLITYPYLIRVLGAEPYGLVVYAQAVIGFAVIFVNFGFDLSATKQVAIHRDSPAHLAEILSVVTYLKSIFFCLSGLALAAVVFSLPMLRQYWLLYLFTFCTCIGEILFPRWFFQGIEKMKYITYVEITAKLIFVALIFVAIHSPADFLWMPALTSIGNIVAGAVSCSIIFSTEKVRLVKVSYTDLKYYMHESLPFFLSRVSGVVNDRANTLIIGSFLGMAEVSYYDLGNKVISLLKIPFYIINSTVYPHMARTKSTTFLKKVIVASVLLALLMYGVICLTSKYIILFLAGPALMSAQPIFYLIGLMLPIASVLHLLGNNALVVMGHSRKYNLSVIYGAMIFLTTLGGLAVTGRITLYSLIYALLFHNIFTTLYRFYYCKKYGIL